MLTMLLAWNASGDIIAARLKQVVYDDQGSALGLVDFEAHELAGGALTDIWRVWTRRDDEPRVYAVGSGTWPEWLGPAVRDFRVEADPRPLVGVGGHHRIKALIHKGSGYRRERADLERAIEERLAVMRSNLPPEAADDPLPESLLLSVLRAERGTPQRPKRVDADGRNAPPQAAAALALKVPLCRIGGPR
jgi:hypothetical protein